MLKKWISSLILIAFFFCNFNPVYAESPLESPSRIEGMLVVDVSNSMKSSDPNKISNEAMKMFIDMASLKGDKIGAIAYADEVMREKALVKIQTEQDRKDLKDFIDTVDQYMYTDISTGLTEAVKVLDSSHEEGYHPLIVLLADGNNELDPEKSKTLQQAENDMNKAVTAAKEKGYPIYTIGLNANGNLNKEVLTNVADSTQGKFFEAKSADQLPAILSEIFANHLKLKIVPIDQMVGNGDFQDIKINVPNENVLEANISLISSKPVELQLIDPTGKEQSIPSDQILLSKSKAYSMLKLVKPKHGDWLLRVKGVPKDKVDISLVFNYDLQLQLAPLAEESYKEGETIKIEAFFEDNGKPIDDHAIYQSMQASLSVKDLDNGETENINLTAGEKGFSGQLKLGDSSGYEIVVMAEDNSFFRETPPTKIMMEHEAKAPIVEKKEDEKSFPWMYVIGAVVIIAAVIIFLVIGKKPKGFSGQFVIEIKDEDTGERTAPQFRKLNVFKGKFQLHQLLGLQTELAETNQIILKPSTGDSLLVINNSNCTIEKSGRALDATKGQTIKKNDRLRIILKQVNKSIYIEYIS
jgi:Ca-activated chloride channel homolog